MDPPHVTEFASERYFSKLSQLSETGDEHGATPDGSHVPSTSTHLLPPQSTFILPLRSSKAPGIETQNLRPVENKRPEKSRLFGLRSKVSSLHLSKTTPFSETSSTPLPAIPVPRPKSVAFDQLFLSLPNELQIQIISSLPLPDVLNLRLVSKSWHTLVSLNEAPIVRYHLDQHIPAYASRLYPANDPASVNFHHLCGLWHRLHVATKLASLMCEWTTKEIFLRTTEAQRQEFAGPRERMRRRLIPLLFTIFHFFEMYRKLHLQHIADHDGHGLMDVPFTLNPVEVQIMNMYDDQTLLRVHQVFPLVISSFCRQLRPPSYAGRVERSLRGYFRDKPTEEVHAAILCVGGLRQVERFWEIKGYNSRIGAVDAWYSSITKDPVEPPAPKSRSRLLSLGRKKSATSVSKDTANQSTQDPWLMRRASGSSLEDGTGRYHDPGLVFSSLSAGMPMEPLGRDLLRPILSDLPALQQIWLTTAEALILDRKIVSRTVDIKRNAQVMLELIREDGIDEEDEWLYGRGNPESVRVPLDAIEEDLIEPLPNM